MIGEFWCLVGKVYSEVGHNSCWQRRRALVGDANLQSVNPMGEKKRGGWVCLAFVIIEKRGKRDLLALMYALNCMSVYCCVHSCISTQAGGFERGDVGMVQTAVMGSSRRDGCL